ncbi:uncharacterized protein DDB_G0283357-like isoform X2 [Aphidius gifuensis]|uniref:uncharacterized protein DDB_G0283357-like isoform X2 n=1 Tax=Aphidius gifuensis TaxID=684658 RepID=UPI001CDB6894|nr:uncharacterized protein DDB_G0283357-like isoform X2 [Aphidius gifuensis]
MSLNHLSYILCLTCALLVIIADKSIGVSINSDKNNNSTNQLGPIKPSPIDESAQQSSEKLTDNNSNGYLTKRDNTKEEIEQIHDDSSTKDKKEKLTRKIPGSSSSSSSSFLNRGSNCCGSLFQVSDQLETSVITTRATESSRYPSENNNRYGNRPDIDRYGWQTYPRPGQSSSSSSSSSSSNSNSSPYGSQGNSPDRYGSRPPPSSSSSSAYGNGQYDYSGRPGLLRPGYGYGYGYNDNNGAYGTNGYEINHRPPLGGGGGIHFTNRPGGYGGMYGTNSEDNEFPTGSNAEEQPQSPASAHLQTQKAVALKALAGVALIGAAAALAANPVLLPLAGKKKKRSVSVGFDHQHFPYKFILDHVPHIQEKNIAEKFWNTPKCVSRLACEVQHEFFIQMSRDKSFIQDVPVIKKDIQRKLDELIIKGILQSEDLQQSLEILKKIAKQVQNTKSNCNVFVCKLYAP